jgi:spermidine synthase
MYAVLWSITIASDASDTSALSAARIDRRLKKNKISDLRMYNGDVHKASQTAYPFISDILRQKTHIITDRRPDIPDDILHQ